MKIIIVSFVILIGISSCQSSLQGVRNESQLTDTLIYAGAVDGSLINIQVLKGASFNHPSFVFWLEDMDGNYLETLMITKAYATGTFEHGQLNDSTWSDKPGKSYQPAALPFWTYKKGATSDKDFIPSQEHPFVDAYTSATPLNNFVYISHISEQPSSFRVLCEVNQTWDWNRFWTNSKFPKNLFYKNSAQPSLVYAVTIHHNNTTTEYHLNPIGHGHPSGANGSLNTDLSTLTTSKKIFQEITIKF